MSRWRGSARRSRSPRASSIAALLSLATACFSLYSGLAAPLAIAIGLMLVAGLTLLPALLAICGPVGVLAVLGAARRRAGPAGRGPTCSRIVRRPLATLVIGLVVFGALAVASAGYLAAGFGGAATGGRKRLGRRRHPAGPALPADGGQPDGRRAAPAASPPGPPRAPWPRRAAARRRSRVHLGVRAAERERHGADRGPVRRAVRRLRSAASDSGLGPRPGPPGWPRSSPTGPAARS